MNMQEDKSIIEVSHVSKYFGDKTALDDVTLNVKKGEFVTILGPSGCGKTTLLRLIAGFQTASEGEIRISGKEITQTPPHKRPVNTVFQKYALFPHLNVYDNIAFGLKLKKTPKQTIGKKVKAALKMVGMTDYEYRDVDSLSGGQQQRVAIARAIVNEPEVLLLDEPLAALDLKMRKDMQMELKEMHKSLGITFVYVTHDQEEALTLSDTIVVMSEGKIQQIGTPIDIYNEPINSFVANFIGESNILNGTMIHDKLVRFCGTEFECVDEGFGENTPVDVVIRPEDLYIFPVSDMAQLTGVVQTSIFKGVHYEMTVVCGGYEFLVQDYHHFEVGAEVGLLVKPFDIHIMKKERICNTFEGKLLDATHVEFLGCNFECVPVEGIAFDTNVKVEVDFEKVILQDNEEFDCVAAYQEKRQEGKLVSKLKDMFYKIINRTSEIEFFPGASDFRTFRRPVVDAVLSLPEYHRFSKGIFSWVGFNTCYIPYTAEKRNAGETKWSINKLFRYAVEGFISYTTFPLKIATGLGLFTSLCAIIYLFVVVIQKLCIGNPVPGYPTIVVLILLLGGIQLTILGIIGEYLARMYIQEKHRPIYIEKKLLDYKKNQSEAEEKDR